MFINFEEWASLAREDRAAFELKRAAIVRQCIAETAHDEAARRRLNGLQFRIDMLRRRHKNPLGACIALSQMMMAEARKLGTLDLARSQRQSERSSTSCKVLPFSKPVKNH